MLPLVVLSPEFTGGVVVAYLAEGRMKLPKNATIFNAGDEEVTDKQAAPVDTSTRTVLTATPAVAQP
jgi:hypothetical protein